MIVIPTCPHTGTMYVTKLFTSIGYVQHSLVDAHVADHCVRVGHIVKQGQFDLAKQYLAKGAIGIIPVRHPFLVEESWKRREKPIVDMVEAYRRLPELYAMGCYPITVDAPHGEQVKAIQDAGIPIKDSSKVVNSYHDTAELKWQDMEPSPEVENLADELKDFLGIFY